MRKLWVSLVVPLVAAGVLMTPGAAQASGIILDQKYGNSYIMSVGPSWYGLQFVADVTDYSVQDRARVQLWDYRGGGLNQVWVGYTVQGAPSDQIVFINQNSHKCLDKSMDNGNNNGAAVYQYTCSYTANQRWRVVRYTSNNGSTQNHIVNVASGQCLDVRDYVYNNGALLQVWSCNSSGWNQGWKVFPA